MSLVNELAAIAKTTTNVNELALIDSVQKALFGAPLETLGQELSEEQAQIWQEIVNRVKGG
jgi:hypothetical protein